MDSVLSQLLTISNEIVRIVTDEAINLGEIRFPPDWPLGSFVQSSGFILLKCGYPGDIPGTENRALSAKQAPSVRPQSPAEAILIRSPAAGYFPVQLRTHM